MGVQQQLVGLKVDAMLWDLVWWMQLSILAQSCSEDGVLVCCDELKCLQLVGHSSVSLSP